MGGNLSSHVGETKSTSVSFPSPVELDASLLLSVVVVETPDDVEVLVIVVDVVLLVVVIVDVELVLVSEVVELTLVVLVEVLNHSSSGGNSAESAAAEVLPTTSL